MKYEYSTVVDPSTYNDFGFCGAIPVRDSKYGYLADKGSRRAQDDWNRFVGKISNFGGCMCPQFNMTSVTIPECLPDRLEVIAYANEFAFLQDGMSILTNMVALTLIRYRCNRIYGQRKG